MDGSTDARHLDGGWPHLGGLDVGHDRRAVIPFVARLVVAAAVRRGRVVVVVRVAVVAMAIVVGVLVAADVDVVVDELDALGDVEMEVIEAGQWEVRGDQGGDAGERQQARDQWGHSTTRQRFGP